MAKKPPADPQSCESCRFFLANQSDEHGYCRRLPPALIVINDEAYSEQPTTSAPDWCGCWERKLKS
jgi:hypothetical protein